MFNGVAVAIQLPPRVTLEIVETEPAMKGQTASSSFKPAKLSNGARTMVPPHIQIGTRSSFRPKTAPTSNAPRTERETTFALGTKP